MNAATCVIRTLKLLISLNNCNWSATCRYKVHIICGIQLDCIICRWIKSIRMIIHIRKRTFPCSRIVLDKMTSIDGSLIQHQMFSVKTPLLPLPDLQNFKCLTGIFKKTKTIIPKSLNTFSLPTWQCRMADSFHMPGLLHILYVPLTILASSPYLWCSSQLFILYL